MAQGHPFGYWLKRSRKALDLTQEELASQVGCSTETIRKLEAEERRPSAQIVERLAEIFNIPSNERKTFLRFARGDWISSSRETIAEIPWRTSPSSTRSNLPVTVTSLIGRENEIAYLREYLLNLQIHLVTLTGPPGIGKTRLSIEAARALLSDFPDGIFFVALAPLVNPSFISSAIVQALGYIEKNDLSADEQLMEGIGDKRILLVLDNCEHLIEDVAVLTSKLLSACIHLKVLATSRESLRVPGEWLYSVPALGIPKVNTSLELQTFSEFPALTLFAERARAVRSDFELNAGNIQAIASICERLDGLPLAIELVAARIRLFSPQMLLERLTDQFVLSADGMRATPSRQKTLNNAIGWSYNLLSTEEKRFFAHLSVFSGSYTLEATEVIFSQIAVEKSISDLFTSLTDKSLLQSVFSGDPHSEPRFHMLETIRQYALDQLRHIGNEAMARDRHLEYFLEYAERGNQEIRGPAQTQWVDRIEMEYDNFRVSLEWSISSRKTESALRMLCALGWPWEIRGHYSEARNWLEKIRALPDVKNYPAIYARLLNHIGRHSWTRHLRGDARILLEESQAIVSNLGNEGEQILAETLNWLGLVMLSARENEQAKSLFERGLELYQKWGNQNGVALSMFHLGIVESELNHDEAALSLLDNSLSLFRQHSDLFFVARVSVFLGRLFLKLGNYDKARLHFEEHLGNDQELQFWDGVADGWLDLGNLYHYQEQYDQAAKFYEESMAVCREHGLHKFHIYYSSGLLALHNNNYPMAFQHFAHPLDLAKKSGESAYVSMLLMGLAAVVGKMNQPERAAKLYGAAQAIFEMPDSLIPPRDRDELERHIQITREQLGDANFEVLVTKGRAMTMKQAIEYALKLSASE